ncbi:MAG TPA: fructosamine kinase family protein [Burkholderiales bacterium]|nr:fructosamine kinase family protein [Burkholderiales bacterium]
MSDWLQIGEALEVHGFRLADGPAPRSVSGGDISAAWRLETDQGPLFLKTGPLEFLDLFEAEAAGLQELAAADAVRVPGVAAQGSSGNGAWLALEWLDLERAANQPRTQRLLGRQLALLHRRARESFGWHRDNTIGTTPQQNDPDLDWVRFFRQRRLLVQLQLAESNGFGGELLEEGAKLARSLARLFDDYEPSPSLLHGDLWGGNVGSVDGQPVMFDPAVYYGDRESDLAMTRLFGGFGGEFYRAYEREWPLHRGSSRRVALYQLYHVLNHLNMFGRSYLGRALGLMRELNRGLQ